MKDQMGKTTGEGRMKIVQVRKTIARRTARWGLIYETLRRKSRQDLVMSSILDAISSRSMWAIHREVSKRLMDG